MSSRQASCYNRVRRSIRALHGSVWGPAVGGLGLLGVSLLLARWSGRPATDLMRDPVAVLGGPSYIGLISNLGVLAWAVAAIVCLYSWLLLADGPLVRRQDEPAAGELETELSSRRRGSTIQDHTLQDHRLQRWLLLCCGLSSFWLMLDDLFLLHEQVLGVRLGIPERLTFGVYGLGAAAVLLTFWRRLWLQAGIPMLLGILGLLGSVLLDLLPDDRFAGKPVLEDASKFMGLLWWAAAATRIGLASVRALQTQSVWTLERHGDAPGPAHASSGNQVPTGFKSLDRTGPSQGA